MANTTCNPQSAATARCNSMSRPSPSTVRSTIVPTPTAAAELVSPSLEALRARLVETALRISRQTGRRIEYAMQAVDALARRLVHPAERLRTSRQHLLHLTSRLVGGMKHRIAQVRAHLERSEARLSGLDHLGVLARGYSLTLNSANEILRDAAAVAVGERIVTTLASGSIESEVKSRG